MSIAEAIRNSETALAAATRVVDGVLSPDWVACRDALRAISVTAVPRTCGSKESSLAVMSAGASPFEMMEKLRADATGNLLYLRLADGSSEGGVVWAEPDLTVPYMQSRVADFTQPVIDALLNLSAPVSHPFSAVTAKQCEDAWNEEVKLEKLQDWQQRFDRAKNKYGTTEQAAGVSEVKSIASEMEAI